MTGPEIRSQLKTYDLDWVLDRIGDHVRRARRQWGKNDILVFFLMDDDGKASDTIAVPRDAIALSLLELYPHATHCHRVIQGVYENPEHVVAVVRWREMLFAVLYNLGDRDTGVLS